MPPIVHEVLHSPGQPLDDATRAFFEPRFDHDFSKVRLHTGSRAAESANAVQARAYTAGREIVFGADQYQSGTAAGSALLAHELTHVVQQGLEAPTAGSPRGISSPTDAAEREAESVGRASLSGKVAPAMATAPGSLFRLGANPNCSKTEADSLQHGINDALGWLNNATAAMAENPLSDKAQSSLRSNFGATYGVAANAHAIRNKLSFAGSALVRNSYSCAKTATFPKCANECGESAVGTNASTICSEMTLNSGVNELFRAACILHETFHATFADFTGDSYSGWRGHSSSTAGYPGAAPEKNADSYTTLAMDLS